MIPLRIFSFISIILCGINQAEYFDLVKKDSLAQFDFISKTELFRLTHLIDDLKKRDLLKLIATFDSHKNVLVQKLFDGKNDEEMQLFLIKVTSENKTNDENVIFGWKKGKIDTVFVKNDKWSTGKAFLQALDINLENKLLNIVKESKGSSMKRILETESIGNQASLIKALKYTSRLHQRVEYKLEATLLKSMSIEEDLIMNAYAQKFMTVNVKIFITRKDEKIVDSKTELICETGAIKNCLDEMLKKYSLQVSPINLGQLYAEKLTSSRIAEPIEQKGCILSNYLKNLNKYGAKESSHALLKVIDQTKRANLDNLKSCLDLKTNQTDMYAILSIFALTGRSDLYFMVKNRMMFDIDQFLAWRSYVAFLPFSLHSNESILEDLMKIVKDGPDLDNVLTLTSATLLNKCLQQKTSEKCQKFVDVFVDKFNTCSKDDSKCLKTYLRSFENLRDQKLVKSAVGKLCTIDFKHDEEVLKFLRKMPAKTWMSNQLQEKLMRLFSNRCPNPTDQTSRIMAAYLLLSNLEPNRTTDTVSKMLDSVIESDAKSAREIKSYLLKLIEQLAEEKDHFKKFRDNLIKKKYYNRLMQFVNGGSSTCMTKSIDFFGFFEPFYNLDVEFNRKILKRASADVGIKFQDSLSTIFGIELYSKAIMPALDMIATSTGDDEDSDFPTSNYLDVSDESETEAGLLLTLFDHNLAPITFFQGSSGLMSSAWTADGSNHVIWNNSILLNDFQLSMPAISGHTIDFDLNGAFSLSIGGSAEISIWYRTLKTTLWNKGSFGILSRVQIKENDKNELFRQDVEIMAEFGSSINTDVDFYASPVQFCLKMDGSDTTFGMKFDEKSNKNKSKKNVKKIQRQLNGVCLNVPQLSRACSLMYDG